MMLQEPNIYMLTMHLVKRARNLKHFQHFYLKNVQLHTSIIELFQLKQNI